MSQLKVFISYSSEDKKLGCLFKTCFENYAGFSVFLAHEDISPATVWELRIIKELKDSDVVIPLITENYRNSEFTDQELGMALAWKKIIIPIKLSDINPYGFIKKIQALKCKDVLYSVIDAVTTIVFVLIKNREFYSIRDCMIDLIIKALNNSRHFKTTYIIITMLNQIDKFSKKQLSNIKNAIENNSQVYNEQYAFPNFKRRLLEQHQIVIDFKS